MKKITLSLLILTSALNLQGCVGAVAVGAVTATTAATDDRTFSQVIDDETLTLDINSSINKLDKNLLVDNNVTIFTVNNKVLLIGQVVNTQVKQKIVDIAVGTESVDQVYDQLRIGEPISFEQKSKDSWITTKVKTNLLKIDDVKPFNLKVVTENAEVFLIGTISHEASEHVTEAARYVVGVNKVIKVFEYK